jgi:hypothetical protein
MDYNKIISVTGLSGLYELVTSKADGAVVRSLEDKSTKFVSSRVHNFSHLESIEIFTVKENTNLAELFTTMKNSSEAIPDAQADGKTLRAYFEKVYPDLDFDRVYASDMKKIVKWLGILTANSIEIKVAENESTEENVIQETKDQKPVPQEGSVK